MRIESILAGVDFGKGTEAVLSYASYFARTFKASVNLLHVIDYLVTPPAYLVPYMEEEKGIAEEKFAAMKRKLIDSGIRADTEVVIGRLQESFDMVLRSTKSGLLVLGFATHTLRRSSSEKLVKGLQMAMLVVRGEKAESSITGAFGIRRILCPTDFSESSVKAMNAAMELAERFSSDLYFEHVIPDDLIKKIKTDKDKKSVIEELSQKAKDSLDRFLADRSITVSGNISKGEPDHNIVNFARENDIDVIVMGARGLGLIKGMLIGSVTDAVLKSSPCPVFVIH